MANEIENPVVLFGKTNFRQTGGLFGIKMDDRRRHMYVIGKTGMGKSELLKNIAIQDIQDGRGLALIDPHGDLAEDLINYIPPERVKDVIYINPADLEHPVAFNVMEHVDIDKRHLVADGIMAVFKKLWVDLWSARMEYILNYTILALLEVPGSTLLAINRMLAEKDYRKWVVDQVKDPEVKAFWTKEFASYTDRYTAEAVPAIQNKIGQFVSNVLIRNIIGQPHSSFDMRAAMDQSRIIIVNISKGKVGEDASRLLGGLLITKIQLAAMSRVDIQKSERKDFVLVIDEFQSFATASFANILSEARKFNLSLMVAHQYVAQMDEAVRDAVFGNVGTIISFRVGSEDAELLEKEFSPEFMVEDIVNLGKREIYLKLMIDGIASRAFSAMTMDTITQPVDSTRNEVIESSRKNYGRSRQEVETAILKWREPLREEDARERPEPKSERRFQSNNQGGGPPNRRQRQGGTFAERQFPKSGESPNQEVSLVDAFTKGAVDFKGKKLDRNESQRKNSDDKPKKDPDMAGLKEALAEALEKKEN
ncbi:MAG: type IV secretion system DNA-binding domain-containing protein [Candidatus Yanofskybacteria bacterium]|nr:type IV secretion system DNA-binding domain-containing protein [Candidatus Yanofskybacteria bacterium]